jgi:hypothetical protein
MESLAALGLVGNVVQLVHFSAQLLSLFRELASSGSLTLVKELKDVANHLLEQTRNVQHSLQPERMSSAPPSDEEKVSDLIPDIRPLFSNEGNSEGDSI